MPLKAFVQVLRGGPAEPKLEFLYSTPHVMDILAISENRPYQNPVVLRQKYVQERVSLGRIAKEFLCSQSAIRLALAKAGIPLRRRAGPDGLAQGLPYGTTIVKGRRVSSQPEQRVIETIQALRQDGLSFDKIAERLTQLGVPTKTRRKKWNGGCVRAIYVKHDRCCDSDLPGREMS
jgi:hypothetical protein